MKKKIQATIIPVYYNYISFTSVYSTGFKMNERMQAQRTVVRVMDSENKNTNGYSDTI